MKLRTTSFNITVIAAFVLLLTLTSNSSTPTWPREAGTSAGLTTATAVAGVYDLSFRVFRNGTLDPVSSLPIYGGPLVLFAHVEDADGNPAQSGTVSFEYCGNFEPKETCDAGLAKWRRLNRMSIGSCYCPSCGGLPDFDPGPGNACLFVLGTGGTPGDDGFRFKYSGRRGGVDSGSSGAANFAWTVEP